MVLMEVSFGGISGVTTLRAAGGTEEMGLAQAAKQREQVLCFELFYLFCLVGSFSLPVKSCCAERCG